MLHSSPDPAWLSARPPSGRNLVVAAAAFGCGICVVAGCPPYESITQRLVVTTLAAASAASVAWWALRRPGPVHAAVSALLVGTVLSACPVLPAVMLASRRPPEEPAAVVVLAVLGAVPVALVYAMPLALLVLLGWSHVHAPSVPSAYRLQRITGWWVAVGAGVAALAAAAMARENQGLDVLQVFLAIGSTLAAVAAAILAQRAHGRVEQIEAWLARVHAGMEPGFRARPRAPDESVHELTRLCEGDSILVRMPPAGESLYRDRADGIPIGIG